MSSKQHFILGTAGHIDHGKSSLVRALTGTDPDRLPEEQRRGVTIELGFAHLTLPNPAGQGSVMELGIVDVPGHADFVNNMVAGVGGMDVALFVVAADDGWMPQSEEHLHILTYLGIERAVVALTKSDLAEDLEFSLEFVKDGLSGTILEQAPVIPVSSTTGDGIDVLREALRTQLSTAPSAPNFGKPLLPVDRAFTVKGIGTVVTGTLSGGTLDVGDQLTLQPSGLSTHVRAIQNHSAAVERAEPGMRTALSVPDLHVGTRERQGVRRGTLLTAVEAPPPHDTINIQVTRMERTIPGQLGTKRDLPSGRRIRVHHGSGAIGARMFLIEQKSLSPGEVALAQLRLDEQHSMMVGDRLVLRDWSGEATLGGGVILDAAASRKKIGSEEQIHFLRTRADGLGDLSLLLASVIERDHLVDIAEEASRFRFSDQEVAATVEAMLAAERIGKVSSYLCDLSWWKSVLDRACNLVGAYHKKHTDLPGLSLEDLRLGVIQLLPDPAIFDALLESLKDRQVSQHGTYLAENSFTPTLEAEVRQAADHIQEVLKSQPMNPPGRAELCVCGNSRRALSFLVRSGLAVELSEKVVILADVHKKASEEILAFLDQHGRATASDLRQHLETSRRVIMPLLERMDAEGKTRRDGDYRSRARE